MFLRKITIKKNRARHDYWALVESVRTERGPRQRIVSYLGDTDDAGRLGVQQAALDHPGVQGSLFEETPAPTWVEVDSSRVRMERSRRFGDVWLALELIGKLGLRELWESCCRTFTRRSPGRAWPKCWSSPGSASRPVSSISPSSFTSRVRWLICLASRMKRFMLNRLYRALDQLLEHKDADPAAFERTARRTVCYQL